MTILYMDDDVDYVDDDEEDDDIINIHSIIINPHFLSPRYDYLWPDVLHLYSQWLPSTDHLLTGQHEQCLLGHQGNQGVSVCDCL